MRKLALLVVPLLFVLVPATTYAASASFFGPIISPACTCPGTQAPGWGCVFDAIQNLMNMGISFSFLILVLVLMYSGFLFMRSSVNPEMRSKGKSVLLNAFIGIVIVLAAWLMVDFFMKTLYGGQFGPWNSILTGDAGSQCIVAKATGSIFTGPPIFTSPGVTGTPSGGNCPPADPSAMVSFPASVVSGGPEKATPETVRNFLAMREAALKSGIDLKVTDGYRSDAEQVSLWNQYNHDTSQVAKPCSLGGGGSNHNSGTALDLTVGCAKTDSSCNSPQYRWLKANGSQWNFRNALPTDTVHWSPSGR